MIFGYTPWALFWLFIVSGAAMVFLVYGKKRPDGAAFVAGLVLAIFPYFVSDSVWLVLIATVVGVVFGLGRKWQWF